MKRPSSSDSLGGLIPVRPSSDEKASAGNTPAAATNSSSIVYNRSFQSILDGLEDEDLVEEFDRQTAEKKRRLSVEQVRALEKSFEVENKLEPERKVKLAQELGLQPRQVSVWFQNRRARSKTKQLEKDYSLLKASYDSLKFKHSALLQDKESLSAELQELKSKLREEKGENNHSIKLETSQEVGKTEILGSLSLQSKTLNEDSDSSAVLDDHSPQHGVSADGSLDQMVMMMISPSASSSTTCLELSEMRVHGGAQKGFYHQALKMEEQDFLSSAEEPCNFFSDEQAPSLSWCCSEPWN